MINVQGGQSAVTENLVHSPPRKNASYNKATSQMYELAWQFLSIKEDIIWLNLCESTFLNKKIIKSKYHSTTNNDDLKVSLRLDTNGYCL